MQRILHKFSHDPPPDNSNEGDAYLDCSRSYFSKNCPIDFFVVPENHNTTADAVVDPRRAPAFENLSVVYLAPWPVNIVLCETILSKYNRVFRQLLRIKYALWALNACYHQLRERRSVAGSLVQAGQWIHQSESQFHQTSVWLHEMNQVLRGLDTYLINQAVKSSWSKFVKRLIGSNPDKVDRSAGQNAVVENLDQLISVHEAYVDEVLLG